LDTITLYAETDQNRPVELVKLDITQVGLVVAKLLDELQVTESGIYGNIDPGRITFI
jgi:hypothetical protein